MELVSSENLTVETRLSLSPPFSALPFSVSLSVTFSLRLFFCLCLSLAVCLTVFSPHHPLSLPDSLTHSRIIKTFQNRQMSICTFADDTGHHYTPQFVTTSGIRALSNITTLQIKDCNNISQMSYLFIWFHLSIFNQALLSTSGLAVSQKSRNFGAEAVINLLSCHQFFDHANAWNPLSWQRQWRNIRLGLERIFPEKEGDCIQIWFLGYRLMVYVFNYYLYTKIIILADSSTRYRNFGYFFTFVSGLYTEI